MTETKADSRAPEKLKPLPALKDIKESPLSAVSTGLFPELDVQDWLASLFRGRHKKRLSF